MRDEAANIARGPRQPLRDHKERAFELTRLGLAGRAAGWLEESYQVRRLRRRLAIGAAPPRVHAPERPVAVKLELTHACNLRCEFCYTDSPRHTLARTPDLSDAGWCGVVEEAIALGVFEAVVTGGEPLLRAPLALDLVERFASADTSVTLNTNGWFVDEAVADRLAGCRAAKVRVSVDGIAPEDHDLARGVPGSWRRAINAIELLLERDVPLTVVCVVTPRNQASVAGLLGHLWLLGVRSVLLTPVVPIGGASRSGQWSVDRRVLRRTAADVAARFADDLDVVVQSGVGEIVAAWEDQPPVALLVRPSGEVLIDSLHPFSFGHVDEGLSECWRRIVRDWRHPDIARWADAIPGTRGLANASVVPYVDTEHPIAATSQRRRVTVATESPRLPRRVRRGSEAVVSPEAVAAARAHIMDRALTRRYRVAPHRSSSDADGNRAVRLASDGRVCQLNPSAAMILDGLADHTVGEISDAICGEHPDIPRERVELDALRVVRWMVARGLVGGRVGRRPSVVG